MAKKLIAGNWKMHGDLTSAKDLTGALVQSLHDQPRLAEHIDMLVCPPFVHIPAVLEMLGGNSAIAVGAQNCAEAEQGAYTGDIAPQMLADTGCSHTIIGHSERRLHRGETNVLVREKVEAAQRAGLTVILCVGEDETARDAGEAARVVEQQLHESMPSKCPASGLVIAYEPVWAIGTGRSASITDIGGMHALIREKLQEKLANADSIRILYGGSVKPDNAADILHAQDVDGALVGGASLKSDQFIGIAQAAGM
jgi:triosephosphate isomerase